MGEASPPSAARSTKGPTEPHSHKLYTALMIIPIGFGQVTHMFTGVAAPLGAAVTYGFNNAGPLTALQAAIAAHSAWIGHILPNQSDDITLQQTLVKLGPNATGPSAVNPGPVSGALANNSTTPGVAIIAEKNTGTGGRRGRGRMFIPGFGEDAFDSGGNVASGMVTNLNSDFVSFVTTMDGLGMPLMLMHSEEGFAPTLITSITVDGVAGSQRRRQRR